MLLVGAYNSRLRPGHQLLLRGRGGVGEEAEDSPLGSLEAVELAPGLGLVSEDLPPKLGLVVVTYLSVESVGVRHPI